MDPTTLLCERLRRTGIAPSLDFDLPALVRALHGDPGLYRSLLRAMSDDRDSVRVLEDVARSLRDELTPGDSDSDDPRREGYPTADRRDRAGYSARDSRAAESGAAESGPAGAENTGESSTDESSTDESSTDESSTDERSSDTGADDLLSDEDAEDALHDCCPHAERRRARAAGVLPPEAEEILGEFRSERQEEEAQLASEMAGEPAAEQAEEEAVAKARLQEVGHYADADADSDSDWLDEVLGFRPQKCARLDAEGIAEQLEIAEDALDALSEADDRRAARLGQLADSCEAYDALRAEADSDVVSLDTLDAHADAALRLLDEERGSGARAQKLAHTMWAEMAAAVGLQPALRAAHAEREALAEIRAEQRETGPIIDPKAFRRLVLELSGEMHSWQGPHFDSGALEALQTAAEAHLVALFQKSTRAAVHAGRTYVAPVDLQLARDLSGGGSPW